MNDLYVRLKHSHDSNVAVIVALSNDGIVSGLSLCIANCIHNYDYIICDVFSQIHAHQVDFWEQGYGIDLLKTWHYSKQYPPSIEMTVQHGQELPQPLKLSVNFEGCTEEYVPKFQIILPAGIYRSRFPLLPILIINHYTVGLQSGLQHVPLTTGQPIMPLHGNHRNMHIKLLNLEVKCDLL